MSETLLITGGTGFAGSHLVEALVASQVSPNSIHVTSFTGGDGGFLAGLLPADNIHQLDLTDRAATQVVFKSVQPSQIYHLASVAQVGKSFEDAEAILHNNISVQLSMLEAVRDQVPEARVLSILSADGYQPSENPLKETDPLRPSNPYGVSKVTQELLIDAYITAFHLRIIKVRPFNHIGERQGPGFAVSAFARQIAMIEAGQQEKLQVGNLEAVRDFTDVKDMVLAYMLLMQKGELGDVYNAGSGQGHKIQEVLDLLVSFSTSEILVEADPSRMRPVDVPYIVADISRLSSLGWKPTIELPTTLQRVLAYWRTQT